uniref:Uncharacterized protein n=1 Tax=Rhizophora mucronata TaxID=61149 RepID=A0A2P2PAY8_RHIMU
MCLYILCCQPELFTFQCSYVKLPD